MSSRGNPHFSSSLVERREKLLKELLASPPTEWSKVKALFAFRYGLTERKVNEYFVTLKKTGLLDGVLPENGN